MSLYGIRKYYAFQADEGDEDLGDDDGGGGGGACECSCMPMDSDPNRFKIETPGGEDCYNNIYPDTMEQCQTALQEVCAQRGTPLGGGGGGGEGITPAEPTPSPMEPAPSPAPAPPPPSPAPQFDIQGIISSLTGLLQGGLGFFQDLDQGKFFILLGVFFLGVGMFSRKRKIGGLSTTIIFLIGFLLILLGGMQKYGGINLGGILQQ